MARHKLHQVPLVSADGTTQPPFPGGWVLAIFEAVHTFAPDYATKYRFPGSPRTRVRIKGGKSIKQGTYDGIETSLVELATALFPTVAVINGFAAKYVNEYFRLWKAAAEIAPHWVTALGFRPEQSGVLARTLLRDLVLRLCYLESCERALSGVPFDKEELGVLHHVDPAKVYAALITEQKLRRKLSTEELAGSLGLYEEKLRRLKQGKIVPELQLLRKLVAAAGNHRLLAGIGFMDVFQRELGLNEGILCADILCAAEVFFPAHQSALHNWRGTQLAGTTSKNQTVGLVPFAQFVTSGDNLLLHPGFETVWPKMPDALWRAHLNALQFARIVDLAQACFQFAGYGNDRDMTKFFEIAERKSDGCPHGWMDELRQPNNILSFPPSNAP